MSNLSNPMKHFFTSIFLFCTSILFSQTVDLCAAWPEGSFDPGAEFTVLIEVQNYVDITGGQFTLLYPNNELEYTGYSSALSDAGNSIDIEDPDGGALRLVWFELLTNGVTLDDGTALFELHFTTLTNVESPNISISDTPVEIVISSSAPDAVPVSICGQPYTTNLSDFCLAFPEGPYIAGQQVEVSLITTNFRDISFLQLPISIDYDILEFLAVVEPEPLSGLSTFSFEVIDEGMRLVWIEWLGDSFTLPDGSVLWNLIFTFLEDTDELPIEIEPAIGGTQATFGWQPEIPVPITICESSYINGQPANLQAEIFTGFGDCEAAITTDPMPGWSIEVTDATGLVTRTAVTNQGGSGYLNLPVGNYTYQWIPPTDASDWNICTPQPIEVTEEGQIISLQDRAEPQGDCANTYVNVTSSNLRPCFENNVFYLQYGNYGPAVAEDAYVDITLPDEFTILSTDALYEELSNGSLRIQLGDLPAGEIGIISFRGQIDCDLPVGLTLCTGAVIAPNDKDCNSGGPNYLGARLQATTQCENGQVTLQVENIGDGPSGEVGFVVIEDVVIYMQDDIELEPGQTTTRTFPANGSTWRVEFDLPDGAPYLSQALAIDEGCGTSAGGNFTMGLVTALPLLDDDTWLDRYCLETTAAYDPNDKQAIPTGVGSENFIRPNQRLDYKIRFQNTGTDTAFTVIIRDTLAEGVYDYASLRPGISSHPYNLTIEDENILTFTFANIMLPDSNVNEPASNGFVHFSIDQLPDLPDGTTISNRAGIYFDFNPPIITNYSRHTVMRSIISSVHQYHAAGGPVQIFPNPMNATLSFTHDDWPGSVTFQLIDFLGREVLTRSLTHSGQTIDLPPLSNGTYTYRLLADRGLLQVGTLMKQ
ncbi:MAG: T9SS type A sorting domain-containing protein [Bacteroidota bacterium]